MSLGATQALEISIDSYCTMAHIRARIPMRSLDSTSYPSKAQAVMLSRGVFRQINSVLDVLGYVIPVASTNSTNIGFIQELNAIGAAALIEGGAYSSGNEARSDYAEMLDGQFKMMWKTLSDGKVSLPTATRQGDYMHKENEKDPAYSFHEIDGVEQDAVFSKEMDF